MVDGGIVGSNTGFVESRALSERKKNWKVLVEKEEDRNQEGEVEV